MTQTTRVQVLFPHFLAVYLWDTHITALFLMYIIGDL